MIATAVPEQAAVEELRQAEIERKHKEAFYKALDDDPEKEKRRYYLASEYNLMILEIESAGRSL